MDTPTTTPTPVAPSPTPSPATPPIQPPVPPAVIVPREHRTLLGSFFSLIVGGLAVAGGILIYRNYLTPFEPVAFYMRLHRPALMATPTPTCAPRPACLDANPRCLMAEPAEGWCPAK